MRAHAHTQCTFEVLPTLTVVWSHNRTMLNNGSNDITIVTSNSSSTLTITTIAADDSGSYTVLFLIYWEVLQLLLYYKYNVSEYL